MRRIKLYLVALIIALVSVFVSPVQATATTYRVYNSSTRYAVEVWYYANSGHWYLYPRTNLASWHQIYAVDGSFCKRIYNGSTASLYYGGGYHVLPYTWRHSLNLYIVPHPAPC
jgi:hypothetical protein